MSHYQHQHYTQPSAAPANPAPISSFYAARQRFEQGSIGNAPPPHLRQNSFEYRQYNGPPKHPEQQVWARGQQSTRPGPSKAQRPTQVQAHVRPQSEYGHLQPYQPPYSQSSQHPQPNGQMQVQASYQRQASASRPASLYGAMPQAGFHNEQHSQNLSGYASLLAQFPQIQGGPTPARAFALYEAYNAQQQQRAAAAQPRPPAQFQQPWQSQQPSQEAGFQPHQQHQQQPSHLYDAQQQRPPPQQVQQEQYQHPRIHERQPPQVNLPFSLSSGLQQASSSAHSMSAVPIVQRHSQQPQQPPKDQPPAGSRRPLPQPGQLRPPPLSMSSQSHDRGSTFQPSNTGHSHVSSASNILMPQSSTGPAYAPSSSVPISPLPTAPKILSAMSGGTEIPGKAPSNQGISTESSEKQGSLSHPTRTGHSHSSSASDARPQSSKDSVSASSSYYSAPDRVHSASQSTPSSNAPTSLKATDTQPESGQPSEKLSLTREPAALKTHTQRRALPQSPTAPPDLSQVKQISDGTKSIPVRSPRPRASTLPPTLPQTAELSQSPLSPCSDSEVDDDRLSVASRESKGGQQRTQSLPSPEYGILDLPKRKSPVLNPKKHPPSPQYGIKNLPMRTKSIVERRKAWELAEQGMNDPRVRAQSKPSTPTKTTFSTSVVRPPQSISVPITPSRSPQPQMPQQTQKLPMPVVRQPQPSRTERTPSWTLPNANLDKITGSTSAGSSSTGEKKTSMTLRLAQMSLEEEAKTNQVKKQDAPTPRQAPQPVTSSNSALYGSAGNSLPLSARMLRRSANVNIDLDSPPPPSLRRTPSPTTSATSSSVPSIPTIKTPDEISNGKATTVPKIRLPGDFSDDVPSCIPELKFHTADDEIPPGSSSPHMNVPVINLPGDDDDARSNPIISVSGLSPKTKSEVVSMPVILDDLASQASPMKSRGLPQPPSNATASSDSSSNSSNSRSRGGGLVCGGCHKGIIGRIVSAMGLRWHPQCFKCCQCGEHLEHVSSYEHDGKPYCHLDYHELFAPQCYSCKTPIIDERFITLDDPALGKRTYHEQHFFCAECGDPFLAPSPTKPRSQPSGPNEINIKGDGAFDVAVDEDGMEVGFTVFKGHPYCEACHVRLRAPKCKACKKSIREGSRAVEALGGKWCYECFVCTSCQKPFEEPSFFQRDKKPFCEHCFSIILRNEL